MKMIIAPFFILGSIIIISCDDNTQNNYSMEMKKNDSRDTTDINFVITPEKETISTTENHHQNSIRIDLPSTWEFIDTKEGSIYSLKTNQPDSKAICDISVEKLSETITTQEYASKVLYGFKKSMPIEIYGAVFKTNIGELEAYGFYWYHSGDNAEAMIMGVNGKSVITLDFQNMNAGEDRPIMKELLMAVHFNP